MQSREYFATTIEPDTLAVECTIKSRLQHVKRSTMFSYGVNITPGKEDQTGRPWRDLHSVVGSKSTPGRSTRRQKPEIVMKFHLPPNHTPQPPSPVTCSIHPNPWTFSSTLIYPFSLHFPTSQPSLFHKHTPSSPSSISTLDSI